ncbi:hypothetical protein BGW39_003896, partial [Mortierella sp. 14UC]
QDTVSSTNFPTQSADALTPQSQPATPTGANPPPPPTSSTDTEMNPAEGVQEVVDDFGPAPDLNLIDLGDLDSPHKSAKDTSDNGTEEDSIMPQAPAETVATRVKAGRTVVKPVVASTAKSVTKNTNNIYNKNDSAPKGKGNSKKK